LLLDSVEEAEEAGLISSVFEYPGTRFNFTHDLIRQVVVSGLSAARRQRLHLKIADAIERLYPVEDRVDDLAHHLWNAGESADASRTVRYLQMAGEEAVKRSAHVEAINHYTKALQLLKTAPAIPDHAEKELALQIALGMALAFTKGYMEPEVEATYNRARELCRHAGDKALGPSHRALALAQELANPYNLSFTLTWAAFLHHLRREEQTTLEHAEEVVRLATQHRFVHWLAWGLVLRGWALVRTGRKEEIGQIQQGLALWRSTALVALPQMLALLGDSHLTLKQTTEGLKTVNEALAIVETSGERLFEAELYRIKGDLLQQLSQSARCEVTSTSEAKSCLLTAVDIARRQHAKALELRSLTSLARLLQQRPERKHQGEQLLAESYGSFSEGLNTADLKEAKALLEELQCH
jgi:tetratricopeptide (TPR) repeat protein